MDEAAQRELLLELLLRETRANGGRLPNNHQPQEGSTSALAPPSPVQPNLLALLTRLVLEKQQQERDQLVVSGILAAANPPPPSASAASLMTAQAPPPSTEAVQALLRLLSSQQQPTAADSLLGSLLAPQPSAGSDALSMSVEGLVRSLVVQQQQEDRDRQVKKDLLALLLLRQEQQQQDPPTASLLSAVAGVDPPPVASAAVVAPSEPTVATANTSSDDGESSSSLLPRPQPVISARKPRPIAKRFTDAHHSRWMERFKQLSKFVRENGHAHVPIDSSRVEPALSHWVKRQRFQKKAKDSGRSSTLTDERKRLLESIGFVWDAHAASWEQHFHELKIYKDRYGDCNVPTRFPANQSLAIWVKCQRRQYALKQSGKTSHMTMNRIARLGDLGFVWKPREA